MDPVALARLTEQVSSKAEVTRDKGRQMLSHRSEYCKLKSKLETLSDQMEHKVMVPMTSKAFMPGTLVHTNEIMVLLGDNWFIQTSAKKAAEIAGRRIKACDDILNNLEKELDLVEGWRKQAKIFGKEQGECVEIQEEFDDEAEKEWKKKHAESVRKEKISQNQISNTDDDLWQRLEELEVQEALEREWDEESDEDESEDYISDEDESDITTDNIESDTDQNKDKGLENYDEIESIPLGDNNERQMKRRVSWVGLNPSAGSVAASDPLKTIFFKHSDEADTAQIVNVGGAAVPNIPSDLVHFTCRQPKSILKRTNSDILVREETSKPEQVKTIFPDLVRDIEPADAAVQDTIVERNVVSEEGIQEPEAEVRKVSKFKAARLKSKK